MLEKEACVALAWLNRNEMIANPEKFHALLVKKIKRTPLGIIVFLKTECPVVAYTSLSPSPSGSTIV